MLTYYGRALCGVPSFNATKSEKNISLISKIQSKSIELSIENSNGVKIWSESITPKNNGVFSTLIIAGGGGWENGGTYTISVSQGELKNGAEFKFVA